MSQHPDMNPGGRHVASSAERAPHSHSEKGWCGALHHPDLGAVPIDFEAVNGRYQLLYRVEVGLLSEHQNPPFALARWSDGAFRFSSGTPIDFEPTHYRKGSQTC